MLGDLGDLFDLLDYLAWLKSCEYLGHVPAQSWTSSYTEEAPPATRSLACLWCGVGLEDTE